MSKEWFDIHYFDTEACVPIDDELAVQRIAVGDHTAMQIGQLLLVHDFPHSMADYEDNQEWQSRRSEISSWDEEKIHQYGQWIKELVETENPYVQPITEEQLRRLSVLGLGMNKYAIKNKLRIKYLADYRREIGAPIGLAPNRFSSWTVYDYVEYARKLSRIVGGRLLPRHIDAAADRDEGPRYQVLLKSAIENLGNLNDLIGFPDVKSMSDDELVFWGVRAMRANNGNVINFFVIDILSRRQRGPSEAAIVRRFGRFSDYKKRVNDQFELDKAFEERSRQYKLNLYCTMIDEGELPREYNALSDDVLMEIAGRYLVVNACMPNANRHVKLAIAEMLTQDLAALICGTRRYISKGFVESTAVSLNVFDEIWHVDEGMDNLKVSDDELAMARKKHAAKVRRIYQLRERRRAA